MATVPDALLLAISSPYARRGVLWDAYRLHYGREVDGILVWQAPTRVMNPSVDERVVTEVYAQDESAAAAEFGAEFRKHIESFVAREAVTAVVVSGRRELKPMSGVVYRAFVDPSGGSQDAMTLAVAHLDDGKVIVDAVRECRPPFSPASVVSEFAVLLSEYRITCVTGDRYAGEWPRERFREHGIGYVVAEQSKGELYASLLAKD